VQFIEHHLFSPPFINSNPIVTYNLILKGFPSLVWPKHFSPQAILLIASLCHPEAEDRLGYGSLEKIRTDAWFDGFDFVALRSRRMRAPIVPAVSLHFFCFFQCSWVQRLHSFSSSQLVLLI
jgi:hypothetical protein